MRKNKIREEGKMQGHGYGMKKYILWLCIILCIGMAVGGAIEGAYQLNTYRKELKGENKSQEEQIPDSSILVTEQNNEDSETELKEKVIRITIQERYINKLKYTYKSQENFKSQIYINTKDIYKNPEQRNITDTAKSHLHTSVVNIKDYVTEITVTVPENVEIGEFTIDNTWDWSWYRFFYIGILISLVLYIIQFRNIIAKKIEYGFLVIGLTCGILFIAIQPPECISWDEHIHFQKTFHWFESGIIDRSQAETYIYTNPESVERYSINSKEEKKLQIDYLNTNTYEKGVSFEKTGNPLNAVGELHMAIAVKAAQLLRAPFYVQFIVGKMANLCLYIFIMFWAIKIVPIGKKFLTVIALMPTMLLQSTAYTYDITVIAFITLGFAMIIEEFFEINRKLTWKKMLLIALLFIVGTCPKPVYIPVLLIIAALPKEKFRTTAQMFACKGMAGIICVGMIMTLMAPAAGGQVEGDSRGGNTNVGQQLSLVFNHPLGYFRVFLDNFMKTVDNYVFKGESLSNLAYAGHHPFGSLVAVFCIGTALTEKKKKLALNKKCKIIYKILLAVVIMLTTGLVWSALYISFTPVGSTAIAGVQARYYIPLIFPLYMLFYTEKIEGKWKESHYNTVMFLMILFITHGAIYQQYLLPYCL